MFDPFARFRRSSNSRWSYSTYRQENLRRNSASPILSRRPLHSVNIGFSLNPVKIFAILLQFTFVLDTRDLFSAELKTGPSFLLTMHPLASLEQRSKFRLRVSLTMLYRCWSGIFSFSDNLGSSLPSARSSMSALSFPSMLLWPGCNSTLLNSGSWMSEHSQIIFGTKFYWLSTHILR